MILAGVLPPCGKLILALVILAAAAGAIGGTMLTQQLGRQTGPRLTSPRLTSRLRARRAYPATGVGSRERDGLAVRRCLDAHAGLRAAHSVGTDSGRS
jgi:hypothetical protein